MTEKTIILKETHITGIQPYMVDLIYKLCGSNLTNNELLNKINDAFSCNFTEKDLNLYLEPTVDELTEDINIHFRNIGIYY